MKLAILTQEPGSNFELNIYELSVSNPHLLEERMRMQLKEGRYRDYITRTKVLGVKIIDDARRLVELAREVAKMYGGKIGTRVFGYQVEVTLEPENAGRLIKEYFSQS